MKEAVTRHVEVFADVTSDFGKGIKKTIKRHTSEMRGFARSVSELFDVEDLLKSIHQITNPSETRKSSNIIHQPIDWSHSRPPSIIEPSDDLALFSATVSKPETSDSNNPNTLRPVQKSNTLLRQNSAPASSDYHDTGTCHNPDYRHSIPNGSTHNLNKKSFQGSSKNLGNSPLSMSSSISFEDYSPLGSPYKESTSRSSTPSSRKTITRQKSFVKEEFFVNDKQRHTAAINSKEFTPRSKTPSSSSVESSTSNRLEYHDLARPNATEQQSKLSIYRSPAVQNTFHNQEHPLSVKPSRKRSGSHPVSQEHPSTQYPVAHNRSSVLCHATNFVDYSLVNHTAPREYIAVRSEHYPDTQQAPKQHPSKVDRKSASNAYDKKGMQVKSRSYTNPEYLQRDLISDGVVPQGSHKSPYRRMTYSEAYLRDPYIRSRESSFDRDNVPQPHHQQPRYQNEVNDHRLPDWSSLHSAKYTFDDQHHHNHHHHQTYKSDPPLAFQEHSRNNYSYHMTSQIIATKDMTHASHMHRHQNGAAHAPRHSKAAFLSRSLSFEHGRNDHHTNNYSSYMTKDNSQVYLEVQSPTYQSRGFSDLQASHTNYYLQPLNQSKSFSNYSDNHLSQLNKQHKNVIGGGAGSNHFLIPDPQPNHIISNTDMQAYPVPYSDNLYIPGSTNHKVPLTRSRSLTNPRKNNHRDNNQPNDLSVATNNSRPVKRSSSFRFFKKNK